MIRRTSGLVSFLVNGLFLVAGGSTLLTASCAGEDTVEGLEAGAPADFSEEIRNELSPTGVRVTHAGSLLADFWFRSAVPTGAPRQEEGVLYGALKSGSLLGVLRIHAAGRDYRAQKLPAGLYTLRYDVQPDDGEHLNLTESRDFLLLCAAADDRRPLTLGEDELHKLSAKLHQKKHPAVLFLVAANDGPGTRVRSRDEHQKLLLDVDVATTAGKPLRLTIVVVGRYKEG